MPLKRFTLLVLILAFRAALASAEADPCTNVADTEPQAIPIGLDAYRQWALWPYQRIGMRAYMRSTYDRRGGNEVVMPAIFSINSPTMIMLRSMLPGRAFSISFASIIGTEVRGILSWMERTI